MNIGWACQTYVHPMSQNIDPKILKTFTKINFSKDKCNTQYKLSVIVLILLSCAWSCKSIHAIADAPNEDTVFYRFRANLDKIDNYMWESSLELFKKKKHLWKRRKIYLSIDETHDPYTGKFRKIIDWIFGYTQKRGETGNFKFLVFALTSYTQRLIVRVVPLKIGQDITPIIIETSKKVIEHTKIRAVLCDRGFYKSELVKCFLEENIPFIIRAKIPPKIKKCYDFKKTVVGEIYDFQNIQVNLVRHRDGYSRKYGFLTNLPEEIWQKIPLWYKQRWDIENVFLACDKIQLKTNSTKIERRYFCMVFSLLIYNLRSNESKQKPLLSFCVNLINTIIASIKKSFDVLKPPNLNLPGFIFIL
jgi:hypothetical protein